MSVLVRFYSGNAAAKRANSTKTPASTAAHTDYNCNIVDGSSLIDPVIELARKPDDGGEVPAFNFNYAYIGAIRGGRYYYVTDVENVNSLWRIHLKTDLLATFNNQIGGMQAYVTRCSTAWDGQIMDTLYPTTAKPTAGIQGVPRVFSNTVASGIFVLGVVGQQSNMGATSYYAMNQTQLSVLMSYMLSGTFLGDNFDASEFAWDTLKGIVNPTQYITSCLWLPTSAANLSGTNTNTVNFGWWSYQFTGGIQVKKLTSFFWSYGQEVALPRHPQSSSRGIYLDMPPYTRHTINIYPFGAIDIEQRLVNPTTGPVYTLALNYSLDFITGEGDLMIYSGPFGSGGSVGPLIAQRHAMIGVPVSVGQITQDIIGAAGSVVGAIGSAAGNVLSGNIGGAISNAVSGIGNALSAMVPSGSTSGSNGNISGYNISPSLTSSFNLLVDQALAEFGRPYCKYVYLGNITGAGTVGATAPFIQLGHADDIKIANATPAELEELKAILTKGFYLED